MPLDLADFDTKAREAVMAFWGNRAKARQKQMEAGTADQGERAGVTAGKNMDGFIALVIDLVRANGLAHAAIHQKRAVLTLPGYFRPTKLWDLLVINDGRLIAAIELKSHVGPSFGNNFNNRTEEAIGTSHDLWTAYREGAFGKHPRPFVAWMMMEWVIKPLLLVTYGFGMPFHRMASGVLQLLIFAAWIVMLIKVSQNENYRLPILGDLAERSVSEQRS